MANILSERRSSKSLPSGSWAGRCAALKRRRACGARRPGPISKLRGSPCGPPGGGATRRQPAKEVSTDPTPPAAAPSAPPAWPPGPQRAPTASACAPYRALIELALARGRNAMAIWRDPVDDHGFPAQYPSGRRLAVTLRGARTPEARPVLVTPPGG